MVEVTSGSMTDKNYQKANLKGNRYLEKKHQRKDEDEEKEEGEDIIKEKNKKK